MQHRMEDNRKKWFQSVKHWNKVKRFDPMQDEIFSNTNTQLNYSINLCHQTELKFMIYLTVYWQNLLIYLIKIQLLITCV